MVRAVGTFAIVSAALLGFWAGYRLDSLRNPALAAQEQDRARTPVAA